MFQVLCWDPENLDILLISPSVSINQSHTDTCALFLECMHYFEPILQRTCICNMHQTDGQHEDDSEDDHLDDSEYKLKKSLQGTTVLTMSTCSMTVNDGNQLQTMDNYNRL